MKLELTDNGVLWAGAAGVAAYSADALICPKHAQELHFTSPDRNDAAMRWHGHGLACLASMIALTAKSDVLTPDGKKNMLKLNAACWGSVALHSAGNIARGIGKNEPSQWAQIAGITAFAGLSAYQGFRKSANSAKP